MNPHTLIDTGFDTAAFRMMPYWRVRILIPEDEFDNLHDEIIKVAPLVYGKTDRNAVRSAPCWEYYRPLAGTPTGAESETRKRPGIVELSLLIAPEQAQLEAILAVVYEYHSYYEPPISVEPILRSETRGLDDSKNPNRWWNRGGDWKRD